MLSINHHAVNKYTTAATIVPVICTTSRYVKINIISQKLASQQCNSSGLNQQQEGFSLESTGEGFLLES